jgi:hypothetical protein
MEQSEVLKQPFMAYHTFFKLGHFFSLCQSLWPWSLLEIWTFVAMVPDVEHFEAASFDGSCDSNVG